MLRSFDIPEDVVVKILCRLPVKTLIRFTSVSKRWRSIIISDPQFAKSQLQLALQQGTLGRGVLVSARYFDQNLVRLPCGDPPIRFQSFEDDYSVRTLTYPTEEMQYPQVLCSCNGLVLLAEHTVHGIGKKLYVWNPSNRFSLTIPHLPKRVEYVGLGHDSAADDYKVVLIPDVGSSVHVYSLREKIWKVVEVPPWLSLNIWTSSSGTLSNGAIHWIGVFTPEIYGFDLAKEEFRRVPFPDLIQNQYGMNRKVIRTQVHLSGCLCISSEDKYGHIEYWIMTKYGVPESWVKLFQFSLSDLPKVPAGSYYQCNPIFVTEGGTILMRLANKMEFYKMEFYKIECSKEGKLVCSSRYRLEEEEHGCKFVYQATVYDETLASVPQ